MDVFSERKNILIVTCQSIVHRWVVARYDDEFKQGVKTFVAMTHPRWLEGARAARGRRSFLEAREKFCSPAGADSR